MLEIYPSEVFEYAASNKSGFLEKLEQGLKLAVHDASNDTRAVARKAFLNYRDLFPARATKLFQSFDASIQRAFGELTETKYINTPVRPTSASSGRAQTIVSKNEPKSIEKKAMSSFTEIKDLNSTGGTTPEEKRSSIPTNPNKTNFEKVAREVKQLKEDPTLENIINNTNDTS